MAERWFYLGPVGRMVALPCPETGLDNTLEKVAARHVSLNAGTTEDIRGFRRKWTVEFPWLTADDVGYLEAVYTGAIRGPLRLIDPTRRNRLTLAASVSTPLPQWANGVRALVPTQGVAASVYDVAPPDVSYTSRDGRPITYRTDAPLRWTVPGPDDRLQLDPVIGVPVVPGETLTFSVYVRAMTAGTTADVALELVPHAGVAATQVGATQAVGDQWERITYSWTPPADAGAVTPRIAVPDAPANTNVLVANAQVEANPTASAWVPGAGCPHVLITELPAKSPIYPLITAGMSLQEV